MANVAKLNYTANEINEKLESMDKAIFCNPQSLTDEQKAQTRDNIGAEIAGASKKIHNSLSELWKPWTGDYWQFISQEDAAYNAETNSFVANISKSGTVLAILKDYIDVTYINTLNLHIENDMPEDAFTRAIICCYDANGTVITTTVSGWSYLALYEGYYFNCNSNDMYKQFVIPEGTKNILLKFATSGGANTLVDYEPRNFCISVKNVNIITKDDVEQMIEDGIGDTPTQVAEHTAMFDNIVDTFDDGIFIKNLSGSIWTNTTYKGVTVPICDISSFIGKTVRVLYDSFETEISSATDTCKIIFFVAQELNGKTEWTYPDSDGVLKISEEATMAKAVFYVEYTGLTSNATRTWSCNNFRVFEYGKFKLSKNVEIAALDELRRDKINPNTTFVTQNSLIRKAYNPYLNGGSQLLSGQMHCHSKFYADDGSLHYYATNDENLCKIHADAGYNFITITDYSHVGEVCQKPENTHGLTWLCNSQESAITGDAYNVGEHMCVYNSDRIWEFNKSESPECVGKFVREYGSVVSLAHPFWKSLPQYEEKLNRIKEAVRFCEVYTGLCIHDNEIILPDGKSYDYAWEIMLDNGNMTWGIAVNDAHHSNDAAGGISNGCVKVFVNTNTAPDIWNALMAGNFVACSNINADIASVAFENGVYTISTVETATFKFIKEGGVVLQETSGTSASYIINGDEKYVRAVITDNNGYTIWTQPIILCL